MRRVSRLAMGTASTGRFHTVAKASSLDALMMPCPIQKPRGLRTVPGNCEERVARSPANRRRKTLASHSRGIRRIFQPCPAAPGDCPESLGRIESERAGPRQGRFVSHPVLHGLHRTPSRALSRNSLNSSDGVFGYPLLKALDHGLHDDRHPASGKPYLGRVSPGQRPQAPAFGEE